MNKEQLLACFYAISENIELEIKLIKYEEGKCGCRNYDFTIATNGKYFIFYDYSRGYDIIFDIVRS